MNAMLPERTGLCMASKRVSGLLRTYQRSITHAASPELETGASAKASEKRSREPTNEMRALFLACSALTRPPVLPERYRSSVGASSPTGS